MIITIEELKELINLIEEKELRYQDKPESKRKILNEKINVHDVNDLLDGFGNIINTTTDKQSENQERSKTVLNENLQMTNISTSPIDLSTISTTNYSNADPCKECGINRNNGGSGDCSICDLYVGKYNVKPRKGE